MIDRAVYEKELLVEFGEFVMERVFKCFARTFDYYVGGKPEGPEPNTLFANGHWSDIRDDPIKILSCIRDRAAGCMKSGKALAISGMQPF